MTINVRIKQFPPEHKDGAPRPATYKVFLRSGAEMREGCRPLEPGEVVALDDDEARALLQHLPFELEVTMDPPTRPLFFRNSDEAQLTSQFYNPATAGRAEQAKAAMKQAMEDANAPENQKRIEEINALEAREAAIRQKEIELGLRPDPDALEKSLDAELETEGITAADNVMPPAELEALKNAELHRNSETEVETAPPVRRRRRSKSAA